MLLFFLYMLHIVVFLPVDQILIIILIFDLAKLAMCLCSRRAIRISYYFFRLTIKETLSIFASMCHSGSTFCDLRVDVQKFLQIRQPLFCVDLKDAWPFLTNTLSMLMSTSIWLSAPQILQ